jgi:16S rRNA (cytosine967-C5)-methyltransferase
LGKRVLFREFPDVTENVEKFKLVLVDAPCTGSGTIGRAPWLTIHIDKNFINSIRATQEKILQQASSFVCDGGLLAYITCSLLTKENEEVIRNFLSSNEEFSIVDIEDYWLEVFNQQLPEKLKPAKPFLRLLPSVLGTDGFFMAILQKR